MNNAKAGKEAGERESGFDVSHLHMAPTQSYRPFACFLSPNNGSANECDFCSMAL